MSSAREVLLGALGAAGWSAQHWEERVLPSGSEKHIYNDSTQKFGETWKLAAQAYGFHIMGDVLDSFMST